MAKKVLLVDDAGVIRQVSSMTVKTAGFEVTEAVNGKDALEKLKETRFDLLVTDINMPEMDGIELIKSVRTMEEYKFIPIIVLSTLSQEDKVKEGREAGASGWLFKPFNGRKLVETIKKFIS